MAKPSVIYGLIILELIIAILGIASGIGLLTDPSGKGMGLDVIKDKIPFQNLTLLGLWFIGPYGVLPTVLAFGIWTGKQWAWIPALLLAIIELIWVIAQIPMVGPSILQLIIGAIALATIYLLYRPSVKRHLGL
jgi:predicted small integral membrane protein